MIHRQVYLISMVLTVLALIIFGYKLLVLKLPLHPDTLIDTWDVEVQIDFQATNGPAKLSLYLPQSEGRFEITDERFISGDYGLAIQRFVSNRKAVWSVRRARGKQFLLYRATVRPLVGPTTEVVTKTPRVSEAGFSGAELVAANNLLSMVRQQSADTETMVGVLLARLAADDKDDNIRLLMGNNASVMQLATVTARLLSLADIPTRVVNGFELQSLPGQATRVHWLEVFYQRQWHEFNVTSVNQPVPDNYLAWWRDSRPLATLEGGNKLAANVSITLNPESALHQQQITGEAGRSAMMQYSLLSLPIETRSLYHILLTIPIGVFFLVLMRNVVGVKTFGTFMPVLIALAFRETQLLWGISLFVVVVGVGLMVRFYFDRLKLLVVPRLAAVLTIVIMLMAIISVLSFKLGLPRGLSIALFPIVIMTMTIERMSIVWEERGATEALQQGGGSLAVASLAYLLMNVELLNHFLVIFPETLLVLLAMLILLGRYSGYRLTELIRFSEIAGRK